MTQLVHRYRRASGRTFSDCAYVGRRYAADVGPNGEDGFDRDHWILVNEQAEQGGTTTHAFWSFEDFITGIWRAYAGPVFASDMVLRGVYHFVDPLDVDRGAEHLALPDGLVPEGVWGLDDGPVYVWGTRLTPERTKTYHVVAYEGGAFRELPPLPKPITTVHGVGPDRIYAGGYDGMVAAWNGDAWKQVGPPSEEIISDLHAASEDEIYAVDYGGRLLQGNASEWSVVSANPNTNKYGPCPLAAVAKFKDQLYVGSEEDGLLRRGAGGAIEVFKPNVDTVAMEARDALIITCRERICGTADNERFRSAKGQFAELTAAKPLPLTR